MEKELLTVKQVAEFLKLITLAVYKLTYRKQIPFVKIGRRTKRFDRKAIETWLENSTCNPISAKR